MLVALSPLPLGACLVFSFTYMYTNIPGFIWSRNVFHTVVASQYVRAKAVNGGAICSVFSTCC